MPEYLVQHYLDNSAVCHAENPAVSSPAVTITYRELYECSNRVSHALIRLGVRRQDRVVFCLGRSPASVVAIMAILKADAIYVPIDAKAPPARFLKIMDDCKPAALVLDTKTADYVAANISSASELPPLVILGDRRDRTRETALRGIGQEEIDTLSPLPPAYRNVDADIAYILYTSGSTGDPKGVMISHLNITNYINWAVEAFAIGPADVVLGTAPFYFDMSTFDIHCPLKVGAKLALATQELLLFPSELVKFVERQGVTIWKGISSLLMYMARTGCLKPENMPTLKKVLFAGEVLPTRYLIEWMQCYPAKEFYNGYGPTEATGMSTYYRIPAAPQDPRDSIPIGRACENTEVLLLDEKGTPSPRGEIGELCIRGSGVSPGYWNDSRKTSQVFVSVPLSVYRSSTVYRTGDLAREREDGVLEFIGRKDTQVKWMGHRIELGEIESALLSLAEVRGAAVLFLDGGQIADQGIVAFVEVEGCRDTGEILRELRSQIPDYMLPRRILAMASLPRTDRGKIDRVKLKHHLDAQDSAQHAGATSRGPS